MGNINAYGKTVEERFWARITKTETCWLWHPLARHGYGKFWDKGKDIPAHRFAYEYLVGPIPKPLTVDHLCKVRNCVNPAHMELVTLSVNVMRGSGPAATNKKKTHCHMGHPFSEENTYRCKVGRHCRACDLERRRIRYHRARTLLEEKP